MGLLAATGCSGEKGALKYGFFKRGGESCRLTQPVVLEPVLHAGFGTLAVSCAVHMVR